MPPSAPISKIFKSCLIVETAHLKQEHLNHPKKVQVQQNGSHEQKHIPDASFPHTTSSKSIHKFSVVSIYCIMKKKCMFIGIFLFLLYILSAPAQAVRAAADGLSLWYERVLPALLPFAILSNILICSNCAILCARRLVKPLRFLFPQARRGFLYLCTGSCSASQGGVRTVPVS